MAFYLIMQNNNKSCFNIVLKKEWESLPKSDLFTIIDSGDETYLKATKKQLEGKVYVRGDIESSSPLIKIARVVSVTSSGNTKYSISPTFTDPYQTDSEEEYVPPVGDQESSSSDDYPAEDIRFVGRKLPGLQKIKRFINFDDPSAVSELIFVNCDDPSSVAEPSTSKETHSQISADDTCGRSSELASSPSTSTSLISGEITICDEHIAMDIFTTLHSGTFSVFLEKMCTVRASQYILKGTLPSQKQGHEHKCHAVDVRKPIGYALMRQKTDPAEENSIVITLESCVEKGSAEGIFIFIKETNMYTSLLKFCDPFQDDTDEEIFIQDCKKKPSTKMKLHYCIFCKQLKTCIGRHYKRKHKEEERVKEIVEAAMLAETRSKSLLLMKTLRLEGDRTYNESVSTFDRIPVRKHKIQMLSKSVHCPSCSALIAGRNFCRHHMRCTARAADNRRRVRYLRAEERINTSSASDDDEIFFRVVDKMTKDTLRDIIEKDRIAKSLAIYLVKSQPKTHNLDNVRQQLRRTARLFVEVRNRTENVKELEDMFTPALYSTVMSCIRDICSFNQPLENRKSQLALAYGPLISSLINRLHIELLKSGVSKNDERLEELDSLFKIHQQEFKIEITRQALMSSKHKRMAKKTDLPLASDIQKLIEYARRVGDQLYERLKTSFELDAWIDLGKSLLCQLLVFNRRRVGEMSRARVEDFMNRRQVSAECFESLNRLEIILAEEFSTFSIMAKRTRPVNLLITKSQVTQLDLLISLRKQAGIPDNSMYLFATPTHAEGYLKASNILQSFASKCGASNPSLLKSANLRKHVATMAQMFCLNDNEMKQLADFLGHNRDVHEKFYRLDESNSQIMKFSKFLCAVGDKNVFQHRGKTIDELPFDASHYDEHDTTVCDDDIEEEENIPKQPESPPLQCTSSEINVKKSQSKSYKLRRRSALKPPAKLQTPIKTSAQAHSPAKSPFTTGQLLNMVALPKPAKRLRWTQEEKTIMETEFGKNLQNKVLPSLAFCGEVKTRNFAQLKERDVHSIYCWVRNNINKK